MRRRITAAITIITVGFGVAACSSNSPNTAVESLGVVYTQDEVNEAVGQLQEIFPNGQITPAAIVQNLVFVQPTFEALDRAGVVSREDAEADLAQALEESGIDPEAMNRVSSSILLFGMVSGADQYLQANAPEEFQALQENLRPPQTKINPRYGVANDDGVLAPTLADVQIVAPQQ